MNEAEHNTTIEGLHKPRISVDRADGKIWLFFATKPNTPRAQLSISYNEQFPNEPDALRLTLRELEMIFPQGVVSYQ